MTRLGTDGSRSGHGWGDGSEEGVWRHRASNQSRQELDKVELRPVLHARPTLRKFTSAHAGVTTQPLLSRRMVIHRDDGPIGMAVYCHDLQPVNFRS